MKAAVKNRLQIISPVCVNPCLHKHPCAEMSLIIDILMLSQCHYITGSVMHLVSAGSPHLNISQSAPVTAQNTAIATTATSSTLSVNRVAYSAHTQGLGLFAIAFLFVISFSFRRFM